MLKTAKWAVALSALIPSAPPIADAHGTLDGIETRLLAVHNVERSAAGVPPLEWDRALAAEADQWSRQLAARDVMMHSPDGTRKSDGENLWAGTREAFTPEAMVGMWAAERRLYQPGVFPANSRTGNWADVGHYTQMIWSTTRRVGCAIGRGRHNDYLVCRYSEGGNVLGERPV